jgi:hypothetical protein
VATALHHLLVSLSHLLVCNFIGILRNLMGVSCGSKDVFSLVCGCLRLYMSDESQNTLNETTKMIENESQ